MKLLAGLFLFLAISSAFALPARNPDDDAEIVPVSRRQQSSRRDDDTDTDPDFKDFTGVVDTGYGYPYFSVRPYNPLGTGFFDNFESMFKRLRESLLNRWWSAIPSPSDFDPSEGNTTSVVKVIDGHKVEINDTVYTKTDDSGNSIFKVRVVNIRPLDSEEESATSGPGKDKSDENNSREELEKDPENNEILGNIDSTETLDLHTTPTHSLLESEVVHSPSQNIKSNKLQFEEDNRNVVEIITSEGTNYETNFNEEKEDNTNTNIITPKNTMKQKYESLKYITEEDVEEEKDESTETESPLKPSMEEHIVQTTKHREPIAGESSEEYEDNLENHNIEWESFSNDNDRNNNIDVYESIPVDLSNDIAVNEMLADQGAPFDPEAEVFSVDEFVPEYEKKQYQYQPIKSEPLQTNINFNPIKK